METEKRMNLKCCSRIEGIDVNSYILIYGERETDRDREIDTNVCAEIQN